MQFPLLETDRLILRTHRAEDYSDMLEYLSDPETVRFEPYLPMNPEEVRSALLYRISSAEFIAVEEKTSGRLIGNLYAGERECETLEIGYVMNRAFWHKGYASEACGALCRYALDHGIHRLEAYCDPLNPASWHLLERCGFVREAHLRSNIYFFRDQNGDPIWKDTFIYSRLGKT